MKNLLQHTADIEQLDDLPNRSKIPKDSRRGYRGRAWRSSYPHNKVLRFLESRVGKFWNDVYSEFCHLDWLPDGHKTREQLSWNVVFETVMKDGKVHYIEEGSGDVKLLENHWRRSNLFYVHPVNQKLCRVEKKKQQNPEKPKTLIVLGNYHQLLKVKGVWYEVRGEKKDKNSDIIEKNGLKYRIIPDKDLPPIHERKFAWGVGKNSKDTNYFDSNYQIIDGKVVRPVQNNDRYERRQVEPREAMIDLRDYSDRVFGYSYGLPDYNTVKITLYRQLTSKELKRHGIKNDIQSLPTKKCPKCGGFECVLHKAKEEMNKRLW